MGLVRLGGMETLHPSLHEQRTKTLVEVKHVKINEIVSWMHMRSRVYKGSSMNIHHCLHVYFCIMSYIMHV